MSEDDDSVSFLGDFALESLLNELGEEGADGLSNVGVSKSKKKVAIGKADIYNDNWDDDGGKGKGKDWEAEVDDELRNEPDQHDSPKAAPASNSHYLAGLAALARQSGPSLALPLGLPLPLVKEEQSDVDHPLPEPPKVKGVVDVFPDFKQGVVLDFVQMFASGINGGKGKKIKGTRGGERGWDLSTVELPSPPRSPIPSLAAPLPPSPPHLPNVGPNLSQFLPEDYGSAKNQEDWEDMEVGEDDDLLRMAARRVKESTKMDWDAGVNNPRSYDMVQLDDWESQIVYDVTQPPPAKRSRPNALTPFNKQIEEGDWVQGIIWDSTKPPRPSFLGTVVEEQDENIRDDQRAKLALPTAGRQASANLDPYNLSNDHHYEGMKHRVRQTFGSIIVQHAYPALKLQFPFYKTSLSKSEARSWHRPALQFPTNIKISFERVRTAKKMKDKVGRKLGKGGDIAEGLRKPTDLTLRDTSSFVLWEFSEEHPPLMSSFAMGSVLVNYYRKKDENDEYIPRLDLGEPFVLESTDEPPYSTFAPIDPGQTQPTLYNNLIKAPLFRHTPTPTDFLVVRNTVGGVSTYVIREIKNLFVVGQTIPSQQVPGPHARQVSKTAKLRTHLVSFKLLQKAKGNRIKLAKLMKYFPDTHELQMRQRLKDFLEFHRKGPHQQTWRLKAGTQFPDPNEYLKMVDPESLMVVESMQVGVRVLQDAGYGQSEKEEKDEDESTMTVEQQLAPWIMTKSYLHSQRDKAWVQLYGEGDPTGRGEGFSFIKVSMKDLFLREGETDEDRKAFVASLPKSQQRQGHAVQEAVFKSEARRIWDAQCSSLSNPIPPQLSEEEEEANTRDAVAFNNKAGQGNPAGRSQSQSRAGSVMDNDEGYVGGSSQAYAAFSSSSKGGGGRRSPSAMSRGSSMDRDDAMSVGSGRGYGPGKEGGRVLRIKRLVKNEWVTEIVRDVNVINAYVRKRQLIEEKEIAAEAVMPTGDAERDKRMKKLLLEEIEKLKKNQSRRLNRKKTLAGDENGVVKPVTSRRCANCGAIGHMKTNRKCPKWAEFNLAPQTQAPSTAGLPLIGSQFDQSLFSSDQDMEAPGKIKLSLKKQEGSEDQQQQQPPPQ